MKTAQRPTQSSNAHSKETPIRTDAYLEGRRRGRRGRWRAKRRGSRGSRIAKRHPSPAKVDTLGRLQLQLSPHKSAFSSSSFHAKLDVGVPSFRRQPHSTSTPQVDALVAADGNGAGTGSQLERLVDQRLDGSGRDLVGDGGFDAGRKGEYGTIFVAIAEAKRRCWVGIMVDISLPREGIGGDVDGWLLLLRLLLGSQTDGLVVLATTKGQFCHTLSFAFG